MHLFTAWSETEKLKMFVILKTLIIFNIVL